MLTFIHCMYINGCLYSGICAARSALPRIVIIKGYTKLLEHSFISSSLKCMYNRHPSVPKYTSIWDISLVLDCYNSIETNDKLQFKNLVKKIVMYFMFLGAHRKQALITIAVDNIVIEQIKIVFIPNKTLKHTNTHRPLEPLIYQGDPLYEKLFIVNAVQTYLRMRENLVDANTEEVIIIYGKPYKLALSDTTSRWIKDKLGIASINTSVYKQHSCRSAKRSNARDIGFSITDILN